MPSSSPSCCCVPGCKTGYASINARNRMKGKKNCSIFTPRTEEMLLKWREAIPRSNKAVSKSNGVCELHFREDEVEKYYVTTMPDGTVFRMRKGKATLRVGAVPSIFPCHQETAISSTNERQSKEKEETMVDKPKLQNIENSFQVIPQSTTTTRYKSKTDNDTSSQSKVEDARTSSEDYISRVSCKSPKLCEPCEISEQCESSEPSEECEPCEVYEQCESSGQCEPYESSEQCEPCEVYEQCESSGQYEPFESSEPSESIELSELSEQFELCETDEPCESSELTEPPDQCEPCEQSSTEFEEIIESTASDFQSLKQKLNAIVLPRGLWFMHVLENRVFWICLQNNSSAIAKRVVLLHDLSVEIFLEEKRLILADMEHVESIDEVSKLLQRVSALIPCKGVVGEEKSPQCIGYVLAKEQNRTGPQITRCTVCRKQRRSLMKRPRGPDQLKIQQEKRKKLQGTTKNVIRRNLRLNKKVSKYKKIDLDIYNRIVLAIEQQCKQNSKEKESMTACTDSSDKNAD